MKKTFLVIFLAFISMATEKAFAIPTTFRGQADVIRWPDGNRRITCNPAPQDCVTVDPEKGTVVAHELVIDDHGNYTPGDGTLIGNLVPDSLQLSEDGSFISVDATDLEDCPDCQ